MTPRSRAFIAVATITAPLLVAAIVAGALVLLGERRLVRFSIAIPMAVLVTGLILSVVFAAVALWRKRARRLDARQEAARAEGVAQGSAAEREKHRRFLARLDHELKNPLTAIRATAAAADDSSPQWRTVDAQARKLSVLVRDLRKLAELETRALEPEMVDLEHLLAEAIDAIRQQDTGTGERLSLSATRVPWAVPPLSVDGDLLTLAIDNVLANAVKYSADGPIEVRLREQDGWAVIEVADSGRGIPTADLPSVFDELARAQNARDVPGSGLGLTLVATIMARHGGDVTMRSAEGSGSVIRLRLPLPR